MTHRSSTTRVSSLPAGWVVALAVLALLAGGASLGVPLLAQAAADRCLVPPPIREAILDETSGEEAYQHVQMLAVNRNRQPDEYQNEFFETTYVRTMARQYGLSDVQVDMFPTREVWDAEEGDLWVTQPATPDSRPSYLNDLIASLLQFVDQTEIRSQQGTNQPFNYRLTPVAAITSGSDHSVFNDGGIPAMQFNHWPDNFYHSSEDRIVHVDATELKRTAFMAAAFYYLANAGAPQARDLAWEAATNGEKWIAEVTRQSLRLLGTDPAALPERHKAAQNKIAAACARARGGVESVLTLASDADVAATIKTLAGSLDASREANARMLEAAYRDRCRLLGIKPTAVTLTDQEREYSTLVPRRLFKVYSAEAQKRQQASGQGQRPAPADRPAAVAAPAAASRGGQAPAEQPTGGRGRQRGLPGLASSEVTNFIDGSRSILDIYNAVRAECGNLVTGNSDVKFAYLLSPDAPDVDLEAVVTSLRNLEKAGTIEIVKKAPVAAKKETTRK